MPQKNIKVIALGLALVAVQAPGLSGAAGLEDLYGDLVPAGKMLFVSKGSAYLMHETGIHGSASFGGFESQPDTYSITNGVVLPLVPGSELAVSLGNDLPSRYDRSTKNNSDVVSALQRYHLVQGQEVDISGRLRRGRVEWAARAVLKHQETDWNYATGLDTEPIYFNYFESAYQDFGLEIRYLSPEDVPRRSGGISLLDRPLLEKGQFALEGTVAAQGGRLTRDADFYLANKQDIHYSFRTDLRPAPGLLWRYGLTPSAEAGIGLACKLPFRYQYFYELYKASGKTQFLNGVFSYDRWLEVPVALRFRPSDRWEWQGSANARYVRQDLDIWEKKESGAYLDHERKRLGYYNFQPALGVKYLTGPDGEGAYADAGGRRLLPRGQFLYGLEWKADITALRKNSSTGTMNFTDPFSLYRYPVDFFVGGTEYAAFFSGNSSSTPAQVDPQNYHEFRFRTAQGWSGWLNTRLAFGYRSRATAHQFSLNDMGDRAFKFRPFFYFDGGIDCRLGESVTLSLDAHYVPSYRTEMLSSVHPEQFKEETRYAVFAAQIRVLF